MAARLVSLTRAVIGFPQAFEDLIRRTLTSTLQGVHEIWRSVHSEGKANHHQGHIPGAANSTENADGKGNRCQGRILGIAHSPLENAHNSGAHRIAMP